MIEYDGYKIADPDSLETPSMVVFESALDHNIATTCDMAGGAGNLMVHVKTHKSDAVTRKLIEAGVAGVKCATIREAEMALTEGVTEVVLSYPLTQRSKIERLCDLATNHGNARLYAIASTPTHVESLSQVAAARSTNLEVMVDLDMGMQRTGASLEDALELYRTIDSHNSLTAAGLHAYDGHEHFSEAEERRTTAQGHIDDINALKARIEGAGMSVSRIVAGCSFTFEHYARADGMFGSPGTSTYWDTGYSSTYPGAKFRYAALVLAQVVDRYPGQMRMTTDLGAKAISADPSLEKRATLLGIDAQLVLQNEEHGVFSCASEPPEVGSYLLAVPGHVCMTTMRYPGSYVVDEEGEVVDFYPHTARDRR